MPSANHRRAVPILFIVAGVLLTLTATAQNPPPYYAIRGARIVTVSGATIENGTVVIANGLIAAVGATVEVPPEAWVIDGKGLTVYPGLIDALTDVGLQAAARPAGGGPGAPPAQQQPGQPAQQRRPSQGPEDRPATTPWENAADEFNAGDRRVETWRNAGFTAALVASRDGIFPGQGAVINLGGDKTGEMVVKAPATLHVQFSGAGAGGGFPGSLMGTLSYIKQVFLDAEHYTQAQKVYDSNPRSLKRPEYDRTERAIQHTLAAGRPVVLPANTASQIHRTLRIAEQIGLKSYVLYGVQQGYEAADALAAKKVPVLVSLKWPEKDREADPDAEESLSTLRFRDRAPSTPAALDKAGVKFAFYSDGIANPRDLLKNAKKAIDAGLKPGSALRALTLSAAEILGVADRLGSIEPGKIANLVVADGDLFAERTKLKMAFVDGRKFDIKEPERPAGGGPPGRPAGTMAGRWTITVNTPDGQSIPVTADLSMGPDGSITGTMTSPFGTNSILSGSLTGNRFTISIEVTTPDGTGTATFSGTLEGSQISGTVTFMGNTAEFTGTRPGGSAAEDQGGGR